MPPAIATEAADRVAPGVATFGFDGGLVLVAPERDRLLVYNDAANFLWQRVRDGEPADAIAAAWSRVTGETVADARAAVEAMLDQWRSAGLLGTAINPPHAAVEACDWSAVPPPRWAERWTCRIAGLTAGFAVQHPRGGPRIRAPFRHLEAPVDGPDVHYEVRDTGPHEAAVIVDGRERLRTGNSGLVVGALYQSLLERLHPDLRWRAMIHGGAVALDGRGIGFPAPSGSGKTTLVATLAAMGATYLADDLLAISTDDRIAPWPMPISIKPGSWDLLRPFYPQLDTAALIETKGMTARLVAPPADAWHRPPAPLAALVFPTYTPGARAELTPLRPFEALVRLVDDRLWIGCPLTECGVAAFLEWLARTPTYGLTYDRIDETLPLLSF